VAGDESPIDGTASMRGGGGFPSSRSRRTVAGTLAAKVTTEGVSKLTREFTGLWEVLKKVRGELGTINKLAAGGAGTGGFGGTGQGTPTGAAGTGRGDAGMINLSGLMGNIVQRYTGPSQPPAPGPPPPGGGPVAPGPGGPTLPVAPVRGAGGFNFGGAAIVGASMLRGGLDVIESRFGRNVAQSAPISAQDAFTAAMYGTPYRGAEMRRYGAVGEYGGAREPVQAAQQIALRFGTSMAGSERYLQQAGAMVQATGGTMNIAETAAQIGLFAAPVVSQRARALGIMQYKKAGELQNPMVVAREYIKDYEKRAGVQMNEIDFQNLRSPGSPHRLRMKQLYGVSDETIDLMITAGMENMQFRTGPGRGRDINFGSAKDLGAIGLNNQVLGLQAARFGTTAQRREAAFFQNQEGAMTARLNQERMIQEGLQDLETAFGDLIGPMHEFQRYLQLATTALGALGALQLLGGMGGLGGGGGILGKILGAGTGTGAPVPGPSGGAGAMGMAGRLGLGAAGVGIGIAGVHTAATARTPGGMALGIGGATAGGAMIGAALAPATLGLSVPIGAAVGFAAGTTFAAINYFKGVDARNVKEGYNEGVGMTDKALIDSLGDYAKNAKVGLKGEGAGAKQRGRFDAFARRRGSLLAAALDEAQSTGKFTDLTTQDAAELGELVAFFGSDKVFDDSALWNNKAKADKFVTKIRGTDVWTKYFGSGITDPFGLTPVNTTQSQSLIMSAEQSYQAAVSGGQTGDGVFSKAGGSRRGSSGRFRQRLKARDPYPKGGDAIEDKAVAKGDTWNLLDSRMKTRLLAMFRASGGRVWLGNGWRSEQQQRDMFLSRYTPDPNGDIEWEGQRWRHVSGAPAAPPGRSFHEIGLAADLEGDLGWAGAHGAEFGLKDFSDVNNEDWHFQLVELPNGRESGVDYGSDSGGGVAAPGVPGAPGAAPAAPQPFAGGGGGGGMSAVNYSMAAAIAAVSAPGGLSAPAPATGTAPGAPGTPWSGTWPGDAQQRGMAVAKVAANVAGFHGDVLYRMIAIAKRESGWDPNAHNPVPPDDSYGLWQINMLGGMGPDRARALGIDTERPYDELFDPNVNARAARQIYDSQGEDAWSTASGVNEADVVEAQRLATAAGVGDAVFSPGAISVTPRGSANVNIAVTINSTGDVRYDAKALGEAVRPVLSNVMAEISTKRGS
jgi:Lysozyme like domain